MSNQGIAGHFLVSETTVKWHLRNIFMKLGAKSRTAAAARGRELGLVD